MKNDLPNIRPFLDAMNMQQKTADQKRMAEIEDEWKKHNEIKDRKLLIRIGYSSPEFFKSLLEAHPAQRRKQSLDNVQRAFDILAASRLALIDVAGRFHARVEHNVLKDEWKTALDEATREVYTYSCAANSLVQAYRGLLSSWPEIQKKYDQLKSEFIDTAGVIPFIAELRNSNNHYEIIKASPSFSITTRDKGKREVKSTISFDRSAILNSSDWKSKAKAFISSRESLEVLELVDEHFGAVSKLKKVLVHRTGIRGDTALRDLERIESARKAITERVWLGILLQQAIAGKLDPYEYLEGRFTEDELKNIYSLPDHSSDQIEYMISLRDPLGFCDIDTRKQLYILFSVPLTKMPKQRPEPRIIEI